MVPRQLVLIALSMAALLSSRAGAQDRVFSMAERQLCAATCEKQLTCAGQIQQREFVAGCIGACEVALRTGDLATSRPWWGAGQCLKDACGNPYNACLTTYMASATQAEQKCSAVCTRRLQCANAPASMGGGCVSECVAKLLVGAPEEKMFEEVTWSCSGQACGVPLEACVAKAYGGPSATCAAICENPFKCGVATGLDTFTACMQGCVPAASDPARQGELAAASQCANTCGNAQYLCSARTRGGMPAFCVDACQKQLGCGGAGNDENAIIQCARTCESVMAGADPASKQGFIAVDKCKKQACGQPYNTCVLTAYNTAMGLPVVAPQPVYTPQPVVTQPVVTQPVVTQPVVTQPVVTQPVVTQPVVAQPVVTQPVVAQPVVTQPATKRDPARDKCQSACDKLDRCHPGVAGSDCIDACLGDPARRPGIQAAGACAGQVCGERFDACVVSKLPLSRRQRDCVPACSKELACTGRTSPFDVAACAQSCDRTKGQLAAAGQCSTSSCEGYDACVAKAQETPPSKDELRCRDVCSRSFQCSGEDASGQQACVMRCVSDKSARSEMKQREKCSAQACGAYERCMIAGMGVPENKLACIGACRRELECQTGQKPDAATLAGCLRSCNKPMDEIEAITSCSELPCNSSGFEACVSFKRKEAQSRVAVAQAPPVVADKCIAICEKAQSCSQDDGGDACLARCRDKAHAAEFKAREACASTSCGEFDVCIAGRMGLPKPKLACVNACRHQTDCKPPGEPRSFPLVLACAKSCTWSPQDLTAMDACEARGCGASFERCMAEKTGKIAAGKSVKDQCVASCDASAKCTKGAGGDACVKRCLEVGGESPEFRARVTCQATSCDQYDACMLDALSVKVEARRCLDSCRWDLSCERGNQSHDFSRLAQCVSECRMSDIELSARSDCQPIGCGSGFRECVQKRLSEAGAKAPGAPAPAPAAPPVPRSR
ncbi:MAG: hypothetical protein IV100_25195 [Myxococcales bacterium]|nr:hypothetical protein [Myxococcales bacterium]